MSDIIDQRASIPTCYELKKFACKQEGFAQQRAELFYDMDEDRLNRNEIPEIGCDDFARRFSMRGSNLMWFLGAGASASAGIPTSVDMIWEFKQQLFVSQRRVALNSVADLSSPYVREKLQNHIDALGTMPDLDAPDEYAALFEAVYKTESDRRAYIDAKRQGAKPSYGHLALAALMKAGTVKVVWTTNFDPLLADACAKVFGDTGSLTSVALETSDIAQQSINESRWPLEIKIHGDFRSRRLMNTQDELREQDAKMRQLLVQSSIGSGLVICGYSGRDESVMTTLEEAINENNAFANGFFWLYRGTDSPPIRLQALLQSAVAKGIDAALVRIDNFDEVMRDLVRVSSTVDQSVLNAFGTDRPRVSDAPNSIGKLGFPVIRFNAIPIARLPTTCRRVVCTIDGYRAVKEAVKTAEVDLIFARVRAGILLFGKDVDARNAFSSFTITDFDLHPIELHRLRYDSGERGMLRDALSRAISRNRQLVLVQQRGSDLLYPEDTSQETWNPLRSIVSSLSGSVPNSDLRWHEGVGLRLDWANDRLWLLIEPRIIFEGIEACNKDLAASFAREKSVKRYNRQLYQLIDFWTKIIAGDGANMTALGIGDGVDAGFELSTVNGFSRRLGV